MSDDLDQHLVAADYITDARRCIRLIEMAVRHGAPGDQDAEALAHVAYLAAEAMAKAEAILDKRDFRS